MLSPGGPCYLSREDVLGLLERLEVLQRESRKLDLLVEQLQTLVASVDRPLRA